MRKLILVSFGFLGWAFYEASGGDEFAPASAAPSTVETAVLAPVVSDQGVDVGAVNSTVLSDELRAIAQKAAADAVAQVVLASLTGSDPQTPAVAAEPELPVIDTRTVTGSTVNMRTGPGTSFAILLKAVRGDEMTVLRDPGDGWLKLRTENGQVGWMSAYLLSKASN